MGPRYGSGRPNWRPTSCAGGTWSGRCGISTLPENRRYNETPTRRPFSHLHQGLDVLQSLPDTPQRIQYELDVRMALGPALMEIACIYQHVALGSGA